MYFLGFLEVLDENHPFCSDGNPLRDSNVQMTPENEYISEIELSLVNKNSCSQEDFGNAVILAGVLAINKIQRLSGGKKIDTKYAFKGALNDNKRQDPETLEQFISSVKEWALLDYTNIINKFKRLINDIDIAYNHIEDNDYVEIEQLFIKDINGFINVTDEYDEMNISCCGYDTMKLPTEYANDGMRYAKDAIIHVIKDAGNEIWNIIWGNQKNSPLKFASLEKAMVQPLSHPLTTSENSFSAVPDYTNNKDIMKHFVIGNNVVIYDPYTQQSFEKDLVDLSKTLDEVDKELGLKEPSRYGFETFSSPLSFKAVRLDKDGNYIDSSDTDNYIAVWTDVRSTLYITKSNKATA